MDGRKMDLKLMNFEELIQKSNNTELLNISTNGLKNICLTKVYIFNTIIWIIEESKGRNFKTEHFKIFDTFENALEMYLLNCVLYGASDSIINDLRHELSKLNQKV